MISTVTLIDDSEVDSASEAWKIECFNRHGHVEAVLRMRGADNKSRRAQYIEQVDAREGAEAGRRLREAVKKAWGATA
jgi:hypothetical protein